MSRKTDEKRGERDRVREGKEDRKKKRDRKILADAN